MRKNWKNLYDILTNGASDNIYNPKSWLNAFSYGFGTLLFSYVGTSLLLIFLRQELGVEFTGTFGGVYSSIVQFGSLVVIAIFVAYLTDIHEYLHKPSIDISTVKSIVLLTLIMILIQLVGGLLIEILGVDFAQNSVIEQGEGNAVFYLYMIPVMILFVGPVEEIIFRGILQGSFRENINTPVAIFVSGTLFGLAHVSAVGGFSISAIPYVIMSGMLGVVLGLFYERTENLLVPAVSHGLYNSILLAATYMSVIYNLEGLIFVAW